MLIVLIDFFVVEALENVVKFEVVLGYRDSISSPWERMVWGNVSRTLNCGPNRAANVS